LLKFHCHPLTMLFLHIILSLVQKHLQTWAVLMVLNMVSQALTEAALKTCMFLQEVKVLVRKYREEFSLAHTYFPAVSTMLTIKKQKCCRKLSEKNLKMHSNSAMLSSHHLTQQQPLKSAKRVMTLLQCGQVISVQLH